MLKERGVWMLWVAFEGKEISEEEGDLPLMSSSVVCLVCLVAAG